MLKFARAVTANTDVLTTQSFVFSSSDFNPNKPFYYFIALVCAEGEDVFNKVRQACLDLKEEIFEGNESLNTKLEYTFQKLKQQLTEASKLEILVSFCQDNLLYLKSEGGIKAFLLRSNTVIDLMQGGGQLISGYLQPNDRLLFLSIKDSGELEKELDKDLVDKLLTSPLDTFEEELDLNLQTLPAIPPISTVLVENQAEVEKEGEEVMEIPRVADLDNKNPSFKIPQINLKGVNFAKVVPQSKKAKLTFVVLLVLILIAGFSFFNLQKNRSEKDKDLASYYQLASTNFEQALILKDQDSKVAKERLAVARENLDKALSINPQDVKSLSLKEEIDKNLPQILKIVEVKEWPVFLSLDLIKEGFQTKRLSDSLNRLALLDSEQKTLVVIELQNKTPKILAGKNQLGDAQFASINGDNILVFSKDKGVLRVNIQTEKVDQVIKANTERWGEIKDIFGFASNIYLLDNIKNQIWKHVPVAVGYSDASSYFKSSQDLNQAKRMRIDSSIWLIKPGPNLEKFTAGEADFFSVSGLDKPLAEFDNFYLSDKTENVYILDSANSRVVIVNKKGEYQSQISGEKFKEAVDLIVDEDTKKLYLLLNNQILLLNLP